MASPSFNVFLSTIPTSKPIASTTRAGTIATDPTSNTEDKDTRLYD